MKSMNFFALCFVFAASVASAQDFTPSTFGNSIEPYSYVPQKKEYESPNKWLASVAWDMGLGIGSLNNYISNVSFAGLQLEGRWFLNKQFSLGFSFGWNRFSQSLPQETTQITNGALTSTAYHYADFVTPKVTGHYYIPINSLVRPYVGVGLGPTSVTSDIYIADLSFRTSQWHFMISPEAGILVPIRYEGGMGGLQVGVRYNFTTANFSTVSDAQYLSWQLGFFSAL